MATVSPLHYLHAHWAGEQSLKWSFWVNLVALRLAIALAQSALASYAPNLFSSHPLSMLSLGAFFHGVVFVWQAVGVLRAGESHIRSMGSITDMWGAQLGILVALWVVLSDSWGLWLAVYPAPVEESFAIRMDREHASRYDLTLSNDGTSLRLTGSIEFGATKAVTALLLAHPSIARLVLTSSGGNIYEARGLAKLSRQQKLATYVVENCSSACTIAFIGGVTRQLKRGARLGFHQYRVDASYDVPFADPKIEQAKDRELFMQAGVSDWFLDRMFLADANGMWFPSIDEMQNAHVVTTD